MRRILIFLLMVSALVAQEEEEVPALIVALEKEIATTEEAIADAKAGEDNDESTRKLAEDLAEELELKLAGLKELTSGGESGKATGELLEEAFQQSKEIMKGKLPYSVLETEERLQKHRIALVELKQELSLNSTKVPEEFSAAQKSKAMSLLKKRDKVLNDYQKVLELVIEDDEAALKASERVLQAAEELQTFVLPRIFWFRGADPLGIHTLKEAKEEFYQARDELWILGRELSQQTYKIFTVANLTIAVVLFVFLPMIFVWTGKRFREAIAGDGKKGRRQLIAFGLFVRSLFPGIFVLSLAFLIKSSSFPDELLAIANELIRRIGYALLVVLPLRSFCQKNGLGVRGFGLNQEVASRFRRFVTNAGWMFLILLLLPLSIEALLKDWDVIPTLAKLAFNLGMVVMTALALRRSQPLAQYVMRTRGRKSFIWKNWSLICGLVVLVLAGTLIGDILGFRFAANFVFVSMMLTALLGFVIFVFYGPAESAALRLSRAHAIAWNEAVIEEAALQSEDGSDVVEVKTVEVLDSESRERTKSLVKTVFLIFGLLSVIGIWNTDGRLFYAFDQITLFQTGGSRFSMAGVASAILVLIMAVSITRSLPAIFELFVFPRFDVDSGLRYAIVSISRYIFLAIVTLVVLNILQVDFSSLGWLVAALGVGLGFGLQEIVSNFVSGVIILVERPIRVGDVVTVGGETGAVSRINIRATTITNWDRLEMIIPNKDFITKQVTNWTLTSSLTRVVVPIGVGYGTDPERVKKLLLKIAADDPRIAKDPAPMALFKNHGASSLDFELRVYIPDLANRVWVEDSLTTAINKTLTEEGIEIPFPKQDVYFHRVAEPPGGRGIDESSGLS